MDEAYPQFKKLIKWKLTNIYKPSIIEWILIFLIMSEIKSTIIEHRGRMTRIANNQMLLNSSQLKEVVKWSHHKQLYPSFKSTDHILQFNSIRTCSKNKDHIFRWINITEDLLYLIDFKSKIKYWEEEIKSYYFSFIDN